MRLTNLLRSTASAAVVGGVILAVAGHRRKDLAEERSDTVPN
jgi:hypothetical protein